MSTAPRELFALPLDGALLGVGATLTARDGPGFALLGPPARGPGDAVPLGPGLGAVPAALATVAPLVGLGLGTP
jgi:hypothetical protein